MDGAVTIISVSTNHSIELVMFPTIIRSSLVSSIVRLTIVMACSALVHAIGAFGIASNMVNIAVFSFQGFSDTVNISLVTLAVSDLFTIVAAQWLFICLNPWFQADLNLAFYAPEIQTLTGGYPHVFFSRVSAWITAFISVERAVAVTQPFRVRQIFTRRLTAVFNIAIFPVVWIGAAPLYTTARLGEKFYPVPINSTLWGLVFSSIHNRVMTVTSPITEIFGPLANFCVIIVCTAIIRFKVTSMAKWRSGVTRSHNQPAGETKRQMQMESFKADTVRNNEDKNTTSAIGHSREGTRPETKAPNNDNGTSAYALPRSFEGSKPPAQVSVISMDSQTDTVNTAVNVANPLSSKERRLVVMVSGVAAIFIVCYTPLVVQLAARILEPELSSTGRYRDLNASTGTIGVVLGCINASINSLVYWRMSTNYRATFRKVFASCKD